MDTILIQKVVKPTAKDKHPFEPVYVIHSEEGIAFEIAGPLTPDEVRVRDYDWRFITGPIRSGWYDKQDWRNYGHRPIGQPQAGRG